VENQSGKNFVIYFNFKANKEEEEEEETYLKHKILIKRNILFKAKSR
jgi:hypothetical protein